MSNMSSLSTALSALYAQRRGLEVTGHNIANANTEGYTRQRADLVANSGPVVPAVWSRYNGGGQGVDVAGTTRLNDAFLNLRSNQEHAVQGQLITTQQILTRIELGFGEPSELGLASQINDFYAGWDDVANNPTDLAARNALLELAGTLTTNIRGTARSLDTLRDDLRDQLGAQVGSINEMAARIAELNESIINSTNSGLSPNDLLDQRDLLVSKMSKMVGILVTSSNSGTVNILIGGTAIVRGINAEALTVADVAGQAEIRWAKDNYPAEFSGGTAGALLTGTNTTINRYGDQLDTMAMRLREIVNTVHAEGQDLYGNLSTGTEFFTGTSARDIGVSDAIKGDPRLIAAATAGAGTADGGNALRLAALTGYKDAAGDGPDLLYRSLIVGLGVDAQANNRRVDIQYEITRQVDAARDAQAGVDLDEEMVNMLSYQRAYDAAARFMTSIDQMLDKLINGTGLVGR